MHSAASEALSFTAGLREDQYMGSLLVRRAVERAIEIVGESARKVSNDGRIATPHIAWSAIIATRHIFAHQYGDVDHAKLWRITQQHLPTLVTQLDRILSENPPESCTPPVSE